MRAPFYLSRNRAWRITLVQLVSRDHGFCLDLAEKMVEKVLSSPHLRNGLAEKNPNKTIPKGLTECASLSSSKNTNLQKKKQSQQCTTTDLRNVGGSGKMGPKGGMPYPCQNRAHVSRGLWGEKKGSLRLGFYPSPWCSRPPWDVGKKNAGRAIYVRLFPLN